MATRSALPPLKTRGAAVNRPATVRVTGSPASSSSSTATAAPLATSAPLSTSATPTPRRANLTQSAQMITLQTLETQIESFKREGKLMQALNFMEQALILRGHLFGPHSEQLRPYRISLCLTCNHLALLQLQSNNFPVALELLKKAEILSEHEPQATAVTYNNLACYYRKRDKPRTALQFCRKALHLELKISENKQSADTHLNMCTILSELKEHDEALKHANFALKLLLAEIFHYESRDAASRSCDDEKTGADPAADVAASTSTGQKEGVLTRRPDVSPDRIAVLVIAYHSIGTQLAYLFQHQQALSTYRKGLRVATLYLDPSHHLRKELEDGVRQSEVRYKEQQENERKKVHRVSVEDWRKKMERAKTIRARQSMLHQIEHDKHEEELESILQQHAAQAERGSIADGTTGAGARGPSRRTGSVVSRSSVSSRERVHPANTNASPQHALTSVGDRVDEELDSHATTQASSEEAAGAAEEVAPAATSSDSCSSSSASSAPSSVVSEKETHQSQDEQPQDDAAAVVEERQDDRDESAPTASAAQDLDTTTSAPFVVQANDISVDGGEQVQDAADAQPASETEQATPDEAAVAGTEAVATSDSTEQSSEAQTDEYVRKSVPEHVAHFEELAAANAADA